MVFLYNICSELYFGVLNSSLRSRSGRRLASEDRENRENNCAYAIFTTFCSFSAHHCAPRHSLLQTFQTSKFSSDQVLNNDTKYRAFGCIGAWQRRNPLRTIGSLFGHFAKFSNAFKGPKMQELIEIIMKSGFVMTGTHARKDLIITLRHWKNSHFLTYSYLWHFFWISPNTALMM